MKTFYHVSVFVLVLLTGCDPKTPPSQQKHSVTIEQNDFTESADYISENPGPLQRADSLIESARKMIKRAAFDSAIVLTERATNIYLTEDGKEGLIRTMNIKGDALDQSGRYDESLLLMEEALTKGMEWLGEEHSAVAETYHKIGVLKVKKEVFDEVLFYFDTALSIWKKLYGENHRSVAKSYNSIGVFYANTGNYDKAIDYYQKGLDISQDLLGENTAEVAQSYNNIGVALKNTGDYDRSITYHNRALSIRKNILGENQAKTTLLLVQAITTWVLVLVRKATTQEQKFTTESP